MSKIKRLVIHKHVTFPADLASRRIVLENAHEGL